VTHCSRCGKECTERHHSNEIYNPWARCTELFFLCDDCQNMFARKTVYFLNSMTERVSE
jgi:hypothetical protein